MCHAAVLQRERGVKWCTEQGVISWSLLLVVTLLGVLGSNRAVNTDMPGELRSAKQ